MKKKKKKKSNEPEPKKQLRCAIYTRKSTSEGLDDDFSTLDAQREACEHYVRAMQGDGWEVLPTRYDDGGFTGANMERPALARLMTDIEDGKVDCVIIYKVDRLSRSLFDFGRLIELFDQHGVSFVSTTQQFDTTKSVGRLVLNILLSFAQFEREMISERTRDKMAAARKRGKWTGSVPVYGYRVEDKKLVPEPEEAPRVKTMFQLYLKLGSVGAVVREVERRGWKKTKRMKTANDTWVHTAVYRMLRNPTYIGKVEYKGVRYEGEHDGIVSDKLFDDAQVVLDKSRLPGDSQSGATATFMLTGVVHCGQCRGVMTSSSGTSRAGKRYRYYACVARQRRGKGRCDHPLVAAEELEHAVAEQVWKRCSQPGMPDEIRERAEATHEGVMDELQKRLARVRAKAKKKRVEGERILGSFGDGEAPGPLASEKLTNIDREYAALDNEALAIETEITTAGAVAAELGRLGAIMDAFTSAWPQLTALERRELCQLVLDKVEVDEPKGKLVVEFNDLGDGPPGRRRVKASHVAREGAAA